MKGERKLQIKKRRELENDDDFLKFIRNKYFLKDGELWIRPYRGTERVCDGSMGYPDRYLKVSVTYEGLRLNYFKHRLIFFLANGYFPELVDHIDRNSLNNNINNLRDSTISINNRNCYSNQKVSGAVKYLGVGHVPRSNTFRAYIKIYGEYIHIGAYGTDMEAALARDKYIIDNNLCDRYKLNILAS